MNTRLSKTISSAFSTEEATRIANEDHRKKVISDAIASLVSEGYGGVESAEIINLILDGKVKHVSLKF